ncbi:amidophosphoribosyltransferase [Cellvibrio japonicus]|uniref:Amidophosphoribosyltransferase n=1 Tax=Cellvibrio japonicus (strain Ueda107) TaxID=498211 RepID=B3PFP5_CELJU|nr:amidophosphoribosyltransferase [Cellvibrio japonicus]ACE83821.1 amidophosphoribosyltransferase [Cellvibrio japonicus Ueda107]QEI12270.1 amidophosphoribosyltransferase [Cellvibrio japonicus]QEI15844.1 amidophosphoribosyltransferase [Cellvibrio japonicus]QEI19422.1 amidophosphoribosyltransferase [Cellvibrio japonicus]
MCGIVGIVSKRDVNLQLYDALTILQHRGQDAAGIVTCEDGRMSQQKANGLVQDVFRTRHMQRLVGSMGIGHVRYPTAGSSGPALAQPFYVNSPYGIALAHNGNLTNADKLSEDLFKTDLRHVNTDSDSEVLLNVFAHELQSQGKLIPTPDDMFASVTGVHKRVTGGYAVVVLIANYGLLAFRDPNGIRPLVYGKRETEEGTEYMVASESVALDVLGFDLIDDVAPGEAIYITDEGELHRRQCADNPRLRPCIFEHVYFARPDSIMDGISVYKARLRQGEKLADKILRERPNHDIDVVIPIPDSSRVAGQALAQKLGVKFREGLVKNRYIGRTFIMPGQQQRKKSVRQKLNPIELEFKGKNVLLVDDSIVRGTTCQQIIQMARDAGAKKVYFASAAPAVKFPNVYGIDMPTATELIAHGRTDEEVCREIGADWLIYQNLEDLIAASAEGNNKVTEFDCAVFTGEYCAGDVTQEYLDKLAAMRNDSAKTGKKSNKQMELPIGLHNGALS